jgi:hypothetical protein
MAHACRQTWPSSFHPLPGPGTAGSARGEWRQAGRELAPSASEAAQDRSIGPMTWTPWRSELGDQGPVVVVERQACRGTRRRAQSGGSASEGGSPGGRSSATAAGIGGEGARRRRRRRGGPAANTRLTMTATDTSRHQTSRLRRHLVHPHTERPSLTLAGGSHRRNRLSTWRVEHPP